MIFPATSDNINRAALIIQSSGLIGLPTETVYGLAANATCIEAVKKIYHAKSRPNHHPLIVHLAVQTDITLWAHSIPNYAYPLMNAFWPGACTLVLPKTRKAANFITGDQDTVALRCPSHPIAQQLLTACYNLGIYGIAAPSANQFGRVSPTTAQHVADEFIHLDEPLFILDGGGCVMGIESTIIDCTQAMPRILRYGLITAADITRVTGLSILNESLNSLNRPRVSGNLVAHYAPKTPIRFCEIKAIDRFNTHAVFMGYSTVPMPHTVHYHAMPNDALHYAQQLYATLRYLDRMGYSEILVEPVPNHDEWAGIADRLNRAVATFLK